MEVQGSIPERKVIRYRDIYYSLQNEYRDGVLGRKKNEDEGKE